MDALDSIANSPGIKDFVRRFKGHYKQGSVWTLEAGCFLFTSWMIYYLLIVSPEVRGVLDIIVLIFYLVGALIFLGTTSIFKQLGETFNNSQWTQYLKKGNRILFMILSFFPGLYFAFKYEHFILRYYIVIHLTTSSYFLYKRFREFELEPFLIGLGMSGALYCIGPILKRLFGEFLGSGLETIFDLGLAVAFLLQLPQKHLPPNMLFGLRIVKYLMCFLSWQTWFILMIFATWCNIGAAAQSITETYKAIQVPQPANASNQRTPDSQHASEKSR